MTKITKKPTTKKVTPKTASKTIKRVTRSGKSVAAVKATPVKPTKKSVTKPT